MMLFCIRFQDYNNTSIFWTLKVANKTSIFSSNRINSISMKSLRWLSTPYLISSLAFGKQRCKRLLKAFWRKKTRSKMKGVSCSSMDKWVKVGCPLRLSLTTWWCSENSLWLISWSSPIYLKDTILHVCPLKIYSSIKLHPLNLSKIISKCRINLWLGKMISLSSLQSTFSLGSINQWEGPKTGFLIFQATWIKPKKQFHMRNRWEICNF